MLLQQEEILPALQMVEKKSKAVNDHNDFHIPSFCLNPAAQINKMVF